MSEQERQRLVREIDALQAERAALLSIPEPFIRTDVEGQADWKLLSVEQSLRTKQARLSALEALDPGSPPAPSTGAASRHEQR